MILRTLAGAEASKRVDVEVDTGDFVEAKLPDAPGGLPALCKVAQLFDRERLLMLAPVAPDGRRTEGPLGHLVRDVKVVRVFARSPGDRAEEMGRLDAREGLGLDANPFAGTAALRERWDKGWHIERKLPMPAEAE